MKNENLSKTSRISRYSSPFGLVDVACVCRLRYCRLHCYCRCHVYPFIVCWLVTQFLGEYSGSNWEKYGQFGDSFGFLTAVFTAGAFYSVVENIQNANKKNCARFVRVWPSKNRRWSMQKFETTFFNILNLYSESIGKFMLHTVWDMLENLWFKDEALHGIFLVRLYSDVRAVIEGQGSDQVKTLTHCVLYLKNPSWNQNIFGFRSTVSRFLLCCLILVTLENCPSATCKNIRYGEIASLRLSSTAR